MHTCAPPVETLEELLEAHPSINGNFGHLLLLQKDADDGTLSQALRPYFESAHLDARQAFHADIGIDLHPDAGDGDGPAVPRLESFDRLGVRFAREVVIAGRRCSGCGSGLARVRGSDGRNRGAIRGNHANRSPVVGVSCQNRGPITSKSS